MGKVAAGGLGQGGSLGYNASPLFLGCNAWAGETRIRMLGLQVHLGPPPSSFLPLHTLEQEQGGEGLGFQGNGVGAGINAGPGLGNGQQGHLPGPRGRKAPGMGTRQAKAWVGAGCPAWHGNGPPPNPPNPVPPPVPTSKGWLG